MKIDFSPLAPFVNSMFLGVISLVIFMSIPVFVVKLALPNNFSRSLVGPLAGLGFILWGYLMFFQDLYKLILYLFHSLLYS